MRVKLHDGTWHVKPCDRDLADLVGDRLDALVESYRAMPGQLFVFEVQDPKDRRFVHFAYWGDESLGWAVAAHGGEAVTFELVAEAIECVRERRWCACPARELGDAPRA